VDEPAVYREEIVALLFNVSSILETLERIQALLEDGDNGEDDEG